MQIVELAGRYREEYHPGLVDTLEKIYAKNPTTSLLRAIISLLLKGRRKDRECFVWYERGVEQDLRITGLYEYYIESMEDPIEKPLSTRSSACIFPIIIPSITGKKPSSTPT